MEREKMTKKRFTLDETFMITDNEKLEIINPLMNSKDVGKVCELLNKLAEENEQLKSDKEHLMGCLIRFFGYDDEDIDYNLNRESNTNIFFFC